MMTGLTVSLGTGNDLNQAESERERERETYRFCAGQLWVVDRIL